MTGYHVHCFGVYSSNLTTPISTALHFIMQAIPQELSTKTDFTTEQIWVQLLVQVQRCKISLIVTAVWNLHKSITHNYARILDSFIPAVFLAYCCQPPNNETCIWLSKCPSAWKAATYHTWSAVRPRGKRNSWQFRWLLINHLCKLGSPETEDHTQHVFSYYCCCTS